MDIKPCPFCGSENIDAFAQYEDDCPYRSAIVRCSNCDAQTAQMVGRDKIDMAVRAWNKRAAPPASFSQAALDIIAERQRQVSAGGWTPAHDDTHTSWELIAAAVCYARHVNGRGWIYSIDPGDYTSEEPSYDWPWDEAWWKPQNPRRDLVRAAALILAGIERLDRATGGSVADEYPVTDASVNGLWEGK